MGVAAPVRRASVIPLATGLAALLSVAYLLWEPPTLDLSAQVFRADLWEDHGWVIYNTAWYSGHTVPGYSLLYPPLGALLGPALLGALCAVAAAATFAAIAVRASSTAIQRFGRRATKRRSPRRCAATWARSQASGSAGAGWTRPRASTARLSSSKLSPGLIRSGHSVKSRR